MDKYKLIAVFDEKRNGFRNNDLLTKEVAYLGEFTSEPDYDLFKVKGEKNMYTLVEDGSACITFDVFTIPAMILCNLSMYYGAEQYSHERVNKKSTIMTPWGEAVVFIRDSLVAKKLGTENVEQYSETGDIKEFEKLCKKR